MAKRAAKKKKAVAKKQKVAMTVTPVRNITRVNVNGDTIYCEKGEPITEYLYGTELWLKHCKKEDGSLFEDDAVYMKHYNQVAAAGRKGLGGPSENDVLVEEQAEQIAQQAARIAELEAAVAKIDKISDQAGDDL